MTRVAGAPSSRSDALLYSGRDAPPRAATASTRAGYDVNLRSGPQMREYEAIARRIRADAPSRILDWGCGYGQVSDLLWRAGLDVTAFDYRPDAKEGVHALERYPHLRAHI